MRVSSKADCAAVVMDVAFPGSASGSVEAACEAAFDASQVRRHLQQRHESGELAAVCEHWGWTADRTQEVINSFNLLPESIDVFPVTRYAPPARGQVAAATSFVIARCLFAPKPADYAKASEGGVSRVHDLVVVKDYLRSPATERTEFSRHFARPSAVGCPDSIHDDAIHDVIDAWRDRVVLYVFGFLIDRVVRIASAGRADVSAALREISVAADFSWTVGSARIEEP